MLEKIRNKWVAQKIYWALTAADFHSNCSSLHLNRILW